RTYLEKSERILESVQESLTFLEKYQNLGINQPRWQKVVYTLLSAISHLDLSHLNRTMDLPDLEIYADPHLEDAFLALLDMIARQGDQVTKIGIRCHKNGDNITLIIESDGPGIPVDEKDQVFKWEYMGKSGTSLFLAREILSITGMSLQETGASGEGIRFEITIPEGEYRISTPEE
ncbi:ATP-binding protein, partial [Methanospirillum hungatei]|uniref:ATP-binding protein n=1 Tax=Methanospirillum hungatei TaxID=2203 RepID=UPI0026EA5801